jgi:hypothetical protein
MDIIYLEIFHILFHLPVALKFYDIVALPIKRAIFVRLLDLRFYRVVTATF